MSLVKWLARRVLERKVAQMLKHLFFNWKTSVAGVAPFLDGVQRVIAAISAGDWTAAAHAIVEVILGLGLFAAKDADKTGLAK